MRLSCEGSSDRDRDRDSDRDRDRGSGCTASCVPSPLCCHCSTAFVFHYPFFMSEWCKVTRRQRRYAKKSHGWRVQSGLRALEWQCAACKTRSFLSGDTCRGCNKQRDEMHDEYINEWSQTAAWPQQGGGSFGQAERGSPGSCIGSAAAGTGKSIGNAGGLYPHHGKQSAEGGGGDETVSALGTEGWTKRGPDFVGLSNREKKRWRHCRKRRRLSSKRSRRWHRLRRTWTGSRRKPRCQ